MPPLSCEAACPMSSLWPLSLHVGRGRDPGVSGDQNAKALNPQSSSTRARRERSTRVRYLNSPTLARGVAQGPATRKTKVRPSVLGRVMHICLLPRFIHACTSSAHAAACRPRLTGPLTEPLAEPRKIRSGVLGGSCVVNLMCSAVRVRARAWARVRGRAMAMTD